MPQLSAGAKLLLRLAQFKGRLVKLQVFIDKKGNPSRLIIGDSTVYEDLGPKDKEDDAQ